MSDVAIIVGGADRVWEELKLAEDLCAALGKSVEFFILNDMIVAFERPAVWVTLHPKKLRDEWLPLRLEKHYTKNPIQVWAHQEHAGITHYTSDWGGSVSLLAVKIAYQKGNRKILLCGIPMVKEAGHFRRKRQWAACEVFKPYWKKHVHLLAPVVRSFSGWTAEIFGKPTTEFLTGS